MKCNFVRSLHISKFVSHKNVVYMSSFSNVVNNNQFLIQPSSIRTLRSPSEFYTYLVESCKSARTRIALASLYVGTGELEQNLIKTILENSIQNEHVEILIQSDFCRSLRRIPVKSGDQYSSSAHLLLELLSNSDACSANVNIGFTYMPQIRSSMLRHILPQRYIEGLGVFHMKLYIVDNSVIITGANLSTDYFSNRQDRYVVVENEASLADYCYNLVREVQTIPGSHMLERDGSITVNSVERKEKGDPNYDSTLLKKPSRKSTVKLNPSALPSISLRQLEKLSSFENEKLNNLYRSKLSEVLSNHSNKLTFSELWGTVGANRASLSKTFIVPRLQLGVLKLTDDAVATRALLEDAVTPCSSGKSKSASLYLASGYLNLAPEYERALLNLPSHAKKSTSAPTSVFVLTASPASNGFFKAPGPAGAIPVAYSAIERRFYERAKARDILHPTPNSANAEMQHGLAILEYTKKGWTFHGKGLWLFSFNGGSIIPHFVRSLVGSPNFGRRSEVKDLELQFEIMSDDKETIEKLQAEKNALFHDSDSVEAVGDHFSPPNDVWSQRDRKIQGFSWSNGYWVELGWRIMAKFL
jgi:CDP-diacylglycerol---glycerol-3-phosphate 3-phosphatidyltransferase